MRTDNPFFLDTRERMDATSPVHAAGVQLAARG
jgi:hypothetical protein